MFRPWTASFLFVGALGMAAATAADKQYGPGVSDTEIKWGRQPHIAGRPRHTAPSAGRKPPTRLVNEHGGINGRKINLISLDDGYSPPKAVELTRRLIEEDRVLALSTA